MLPPRNISIISVQAPIELNTRYLYQLDATDDLSLGIIPLQWIIKSTTNTKITPAFSIEHNTVNIPRMTIIGKLQSLDVADFKVSNISWTTDGTSSTTNKPTELPCMLPEFNSIFSKSPMNVGRTNLLQMDIPAAGVTGACKPYLILLKIRSSSMRK